MHHGATQDHPDPWCTRIDLRDEPRLLISRAADHEHDDILRLLAGIRTAFDERVGLFAETPLDEVVEGLLHTWRVLRVHVLHTFETLEAAPCSGEYGFGFEELFLALEGRGVREEVFDGLVIISSGRGGEEVVAYIDITLGYSPDAQEV